MNKLSQQKQVEVLNLLVEGNSVRAASRISGVAKGTILSLLAKVGKKCKAYQEKVLRNLPCKRVQCDEIWAFCYAKEKNVPEEMKGQFGIGDVWTWTALCADSKLIVSWLVGGRSAKYATIFIKDLATRLANRVQLTTDGHKAYIQAVEAGFAGNVDYAMLIKIYGEERQTAARYSPAYCTGTQKFTIEGKPEKRAVSTSYVERQNLTMRMGMRRFTRLTNGFSKKVENLEHSVALHFMHYNFCRIHKSLRVTPAMEAKVTDHVWSLEEVLNLIG